MKSGAFEAPASGARPATIECASVAKIVGRKLVIWEGRASSHGKVQSPSAASLIMQAVCLRLARDWEELAWMVWLAVWHCSECMGWTLAYLILRSNWPVFLTTLDGWDLRPSVLWFTTSKPRVIRVYIYTHTTYDYIIWLNSKDPTTPSHAVIIIDG